jgi:chromosome segregation ATPase
MTYQFLLTVSLFGATALGFLFAWLYRQGKLNAAREEIKNLELELKDCQNAYNRISAENEASKLSASNLESLLRQFEEHNMNVEKNYESLQVSHRLLHEELKELKNNPKEVIREIEVHREVPVLVFREKKLPMDKEEKAIRLVKAFKKGGKSKKKIIAPTIKEE